MRGICLFSKDLNHGFGAGGLKKPIFRKYRTSSGTETKVMLMRTGANSLWIAQANTKALVPAASFDCTRASSNPNLKRMAAISTPLKGRKNNDQLTDNIFNACEMIFVYTATFLQVILRKYHSLISRFPSSGYYFQDMHFKIYSNIPFLKFLETLQNSPPFKTTNNLKLECVFCGIPHSLLNNLIHYFAKHTKTKHCDMKL